MNIKFSLFTLVSLLMICSCKPKSTTTATNTIQKAYYFHSVASGQEAIAKDDLENFFDLITIEDICLQLNMPPENFGDRADAVKVYKDFIQTNVSPFNKKEEAVLTSIFDEIVSAFGKERFERLFPKKVGLIKIEPDHYGPSVFYTREEEIIIPSNIFSMMPEDKIKDVMLHELFHIYSRTTGDRKALYQSIGYFEAKFKDFNERTLLNPDGLDMGYAIQLEQDTFWNFLEGNPRANYQASFFRNVVIGYVNQKGEKSMRLPKGLESSYYDQIGRNTQYLIHPDEVLADNFILWYKVYVDKSKALTEVTSPKIVENLEGLIQK